MTKQTALIVWLVCLVINAVAQIPQFSAVVGLACLLISLVTERRHNASPRNQTR